MIDAMDTMDTMDTMEAMDIMDIETLDYDISRIAASKTPLSADVVFIRADGCTYVFDTGALPENAEYIREIEGRKILIISHFHPDHTGCLKEYDMGFSEIYAAAYTFKHLGDIKGEALLKTVTEPCVLGTVGIVPFPSSHAKGCLVIKYKKRLFAGDALYGKLCIRDSRIKTTQYNVQQLLAGMRLIQDAGADTICLSHHVNFEMKKEVILCFMRLLYEGRQPDSPYVDSTTAIIKD